MFSLGKGWNSLYQCSNEYFCNEELAEQVFFLSAVQTKVTGKVQCVNIFFPKRWKNAVIYLSEFQMEHGIVRETIWRLKSNIIMKESVHQF